MPAGELMAGGRSITLTGKDRPELFRGTLLSLVENDLGGWRILIRIEPGPRAAEFLPIAAELLAGLDYDIRINATVLGIRKNPFSAIDDAFGEGSELNLCLEEDLLVSPDATALALWYQLNHRQNWLLLGLLAGPCGTQGLLSNERYPEILFTAKVSNSIGVAIRREEWTRWIRPAWNGERRLLPWQGALAWRYVWGWDWSLYALLATTPDLVAVQPALARATHTGRVGTYTLAAFHDLAFGSLPINRSKSVDYRLVEEADLPAEVRSHAQAHRELTQMRLTVEAVGRGKPRRTVDKAWDRGRRIPRRR